MKTDFFFKFWLLTSLFRIASLHVIKEKVFFNWQLLLTYLFMCNMLFKTLILIKVRLHCIDIIAYHCIIFNDDVIIMFKRVFPFKQEMHNSLLQRNIPQKKINIFKKQKYWYITHTWSDKSFQGYRCKSGIAIFQRRVTWNYTYSPFEINISSKLLLLKTIFV